MKLRPFLSHKREDQAAVRQLKLELALRGAGGWKDTDDLLLGEHTPAAMRRAIRSETNGFIWFGTPKVIDSGFVNGIEIPEALARKEADDDYPLVPLFAELRPSSELEAALGTRLGEGPARRFLACNGVIVEDGEGLDALVARTASRYVRDAVRRLGDGPVTAGFTALREPSGEQELTFDWRSLLDPRTRLLTAEADATMVRVLADGAAALQAIAPAPSVEITLDVPLPVAFLIGYEWRITARMQLAVRQRTGAHEQLITGAGPTARSWPDPMVESLRGAGPVVLAVSAATDFRGAVERYADDVGARRIVRVHADGLLHPDALRGLARETASQLKELNNQGIPKHLLLLGPGALALFAGAASNAVGATVVPFWDGTRFVSPIVVGST